MHRSILSTAALAASLPVYPALAQDASAASIDTVAADAAAAAAPVPGNAAAEHPDTDQAIVVTGVKRPAGDILGGVSVMSKSGHAFIKATMRDLGVAPCRFARPWPFAPRNSAR